MVFTAFFPNLQEIENLYLGRARSEEVSCDAGKDEMPDFVWLNVTAGYEGGRWKRTSLSISGIAVRA
jgi:hypothetical protein